MILCASKSIVKTAYNSGLAKWWLDGSTIGGFTKPGNGSGWTNNIQP